MAAHRGQPDIAENARPVKMGVLRCGIRHQPIDGKGSQSLQKDAEEAQQPAGDALPVRKIRRAGHDARGKAAPWQFIRMAKQEVADPCHDRSEQPDRQKLSDPCPVQIVVDPDRVHRLFLPDPLCRISDPSDNGPFRLFQTVSAFFSVLSHRFEGMRLRLSVSHV